MNPITGEAIQLLLIFIGIGVLIILGCWIALGFYIGRKGK